MAVYEDDSIVGHVPYNLACYLPLLLARDVNKAFDEIIGGKVNMGAHESRIRALHVRYLWT